MTDATRCHLKRWTLRPLSRPSRHWKQMAPLVPPPFFFFRFVFSTNCTYFILSNTTIRLEENLLLAGKIRNENNSEYRHLTLTSTQAAMFLYARCWMLALGYAAMSVLKLQWQIRNDESFSINTARLYQSHLTNTEAVLSEWHSVRASITNAQKILSEWHSVRATITSRTLLCN